MIVKVSGVPRAGKTYWLVWTLLHEFCVSERKYFRNYYNPEKVRDGITIFSNIIDLKISHINLDEAIESSGVGVNGFFSEEYQSKIHKKYPKIVYAIDECHNYFTYALKDEKVFNYFRMHGHDGDIIYLLSQDLGALPQRITNLAEFEVRPASRITSIANTSIYKYMSKGDILETKTLVRSKKIFALYKSQNTSESTKKKNPLLKFIIVPLICLPFLVVFAYKTFRGVWGMDGKESTMSNSHITTRSSIGSKVHKKGTGYRSLSVPLELGFFRVGKKIYIIDGDDVVEYNSYQKQYLIKVSPMKTVVYKIKG